MRKVVFFTLILFCIDSTFAVTHSLQYVYTSMSGIPDFPEFVSVGLVNGEPIDYYDSKIRRVTPRQRWLEQSVGPDYWEQQNQYSWYAEGVMKRSIEVAKKLFNHSEGIHTYQNIYGCEWDDETGVTGAHDQYGYDGSDFIMLDFKTMSFVAPVQQAVPTKWKWDDDREGLGEEKYYFTKICIEWLKKYVSYTLERTVRPEVSLLQKDPSSPVTCHVTGFFPKGIVVTWQKDEVDMDSDVEVGETLPNGDGTFQISSKLTVKPEDWKRNSYSCVVQHKSSKKDIPVLLEEKNIRTNQGGVSWGIIIGCVAAALALVAVVTGVVLWRKSRTVSDTDSGKTSLQSLSSSDSEKTSSNSNQKRESILPNVTPPEPQLHDVTIERSHSIMVPLHPHYGPHLGGIWREEVM